MKQWTITQDFINNGKIPSSAQAGFIVETEGYYSKGDGGGAQWRFTGVTGQTPSQNPAQLGDAKLTDASGNEFALLFKSEINVRVLGASNDGTDEKNTLIAGFNALSAIGGGNLKIDSDTRIRILSNFDIPQNCCLLGDYEYLDVTNRIAWPTFGSRIRLSSTATIGMGNGAKIKGILIYRDDMTFPPAGLTTAEVALYSGTAITVKSASPYVGYSTFLGFDKALTTVATNTPRGRVEYCNVDCINGFEVDLDLGAWTFAFNFLQPILSNSDADNIRSGIGFDIKNKSDWTTLIGNFTFQDIGYRITDSNQIKLIDCGADHPTDGTDLYHTGVGFEIKGNSLDNYLIGCQSASHKSGLQIQVDAGNRNYVSDTHLWNMASNGFGYEVLGGSLSISGGSIRDFTSAGGKGVFVNNANSEVSAVSGVVFDGLAVAMDTPAYNEFLVSQDLVFKSITNVRTSESLRQIVSAGNITPLPNEQIQEITGTTTIGTFIGQGVMPQKIITFIITDGLTLNNGNTLLDGGVNWAASAGSSITLQYITGNTWREISRNTQ